MEDANESSSSSDPFASSYVDSEAEEQRKERDRLLRHASAMENEGPASWALSRCKNMRMKELDINELR